MLGSKGKLQQKYKNLLYQIIFVRFNKAKFRKVKDRSTQQKDCNIQQNLIIYMGKIEFNFSEIDLVKYILHIEASTGDVL